MRRVRPRACHPRTSVGVANVLLVSEPGSGRLGAPLSAARGYPRVRVHRTYLSFLWGLLKAKVEDLEIDFRDRLQTTLTGAYRVERELGGGGMSRVFLAEERALCRRVVVKVLSPHLAAGVNFERFKHEIMLTAQLQHPHILPVFTTGETEGLPYYTMPFVEGESLRVHLMRAGAMPIAVVVSILRDVARALEFAHAKGVVHRDIKPDNILLAGNTATVSDFGIAKALLASHAVTVSAPMTELGMVIGTPVYMAPEQAAADTGLDHRVDLYSLGCVAYEMIAGEPPFAGSVASLIRAHIVDAPPPIVTKRADVPEALAALVERCLQKDPDDRPASAREVLEVLDNLASAHTRGPGSTAGAEVPTIAVLPFAVVTGEQETGHFADGLTDEVITDLSMIKTLRVISRQSAMRLKGSDKDLRTIARELGARYVLTGSIRRAGSSLRITAQLVDARTDVQLWADKFQGVLEDVFEIQERLSRQIVDALRLRLTPTEDRRLAQRPIGDVRAYQYYLLARQEIWSFNTQSLDHALQLVRRAEDIVGDNELLFVAEGLIYWQYVNVGIVPVSQYDEYLQKADDCAAKVFALNRGILERPRFARSDPTHPCRLERSGRRLQEGVDPRSQRSRGAALAWLSLRRVRATRSRASTHGSPAAGGSADVDQPHDVRDGRDVRRQLSRSAHLDPTVGRHRSGESNAAHDARADAGGERASRGGRGDAR